MRVKDHPILGPQPVLKEVKITMDGKEIKAFEGEMIASALTAAGIKVFRYTSKNSEPRGVFCAIGRCTDCVMIVNGTPNVRTCVTPVENDMVIKTQKGLGQWKDGGQTA